MTTSRMADSDQEGRDDKFMDVDRMVNEGLGGGTVSADNGYISDTTTDTMNNESAYVPNENSANRANRANDMEG